MANTNTSYLRKKNKKGKGQIKADLLAEFCSPFDDSYFEDGFLNFYVPKSVIPNSSSRSPNIIFPDYLSDFKKLRNINNQISEIRDSILKDLAPKLNCHRKYIWVLEVGILSLVCGSSFDLLKRQKRFDWLIENCPNCTIEVSEFELDHVIPQSIESCGLLFDNTWHAMVNQLVAAEYSDFDILVRSDETTPAPIHYITKNILGSMG